MLEKMILSQGNSRAAKIYTTVFIKNDVCIMKLF